MQFSIVVPNYNGSSLLREHFGSLYAFASSHDMELIVVDDASNDDSVEFLRGAYPTVRTLVNPQNLGFGDTCNRGVDEALAPHVFLFNTDIEIRTIDLDVLEEYLARPECFAVTFQSLYPGSETFREGAKRLTFRSGLPFTLHNPKDQRTDAQGNAISVYPVGGHCVVSRSRFLELGGFAACYAPFYWEDMELGLRAHRRGWVTYYDERLTVLHDHQGTIKSGFQREFIESVKLRNRILFMMRNFTPAEKLYRFYPGMLLRAAVSVFRRRWSFFSAWREARAKVGQG